MSDDRESGPDLSAIGVRAGVVLAMLIAATLFLRLLMWSLLPPQSASGPWNPPLQPAPQSAGYSNGGVTAVEAPATQPPVARFVGN